MTNLRHIMRPINCRVRYALATLGVLCGVLALSGCGQIDALRGSAPSPTLVRASKFLRNGDSVGAIKEFDKAISADRNNIDLYLDIMGVCFSAGKMDLVAQYGEMANAATSKAPAEKRARVVRMVGDAYLQLAAGDDPATRTVNTAKAIENYEAALKLQPGDPTLMNNLGYAYAEHYDLSMPGASKLQDALRLTRTAVTEARKAGVSDREMGVFVDSLGWVFYKLQNYDEAVANLSRAANLAPEQKEIHVHLAQALHAKGRTDEAIIELNRALQIDPGYRVAQEQRKQWKQDAPMGSSEKGATRSTPDGITGPSGVKRASPLMRSAP